MMKQKKDANSGCFSGMIRRMLCTENVRTENSSPSNHTTTTSILLNNGLAETKTEAKVCPNLVARLMGLDSLPPITTNYSSPSLLPRSRSVNFAEYLLSFDPKNDINSHSSHSHRRARTEFVFVYLDSDDQSSKPEEKKSIIENMKKKKNNKTDKNYEPPRKALPKKKRKIMKTENEKKVPEKFARKRRISNLQSNKARMIERDPEKLIGLRKSLPSDGNSRPVSSISKTKTKSLEQKDSCHRKDEIELRSIIKKENNDNCTDIKDIFDLDQLAELLLKLTHRDLSKSNWAIPISNTRKSELDEFDDVCMEFEKLILDVLLNEIATDFVQMY